MNSIREEITGTIIANQVRLERAKHDGSFLLVEGGDDAKLFSKFVALNECSIVVCLGRENLIEARTSLHHSEFDGVLGVCDKDFCEFTGYPNYEGEVIFTDDNDIEIMAMRSPALLNIIREFGSEERANAVAEVAGKRIDALIFDEARYLGVFRLLSQRQRWFLKFQGMTYRFMDRRSFEIDQVRTIQQVMGRSAERPDYTDDEVRQLIAGEMDSHDISNVVCCGHDCVRILGRALRYKLGNSNQFDSELGADYLGRVLRLSYEYEFFRATDMYQSVREWEDRAGFRVLRD